MQANLKAISYWAKANKWKARILMVCLHFLFIGIAWFLGNELLLMNIRFPDYFTWIIALSFIIAYGLYPSHRTPGKKRPSYLFRKTLDFIIVCTSFMTVLQAGNNPTSLFLSVNNNSLAVSIRNINLHKTPEDFARSMKDKEGHRLALKERRKLLKTQIKAIKVSDESTGNKALLIILSILIALGLFAGLAAIACELSCNGNEALAGVVMIGGTFLIIFLLVLVIKRIKKGPDKGQPAQT